MIEITLAGCLIAAGIGLVIEKTKSAELHRENVALKKKLYAVRVKGQRDMLTLRADSNSNVVALQMEIFHQNETICDLREQLAYKERLLQQKWTTARE